MHSIDGRVAKFAALACLALASHSAQALELRGFRGLAWGHGVEALGPSRVVHAAGDLSCHEREHENLMFGEQPVKLIRYCFHKNHLFMVTVDAASGVKAMTSEFGLSYGQPRARLSNRASWGTASSVARAELVALPRDASASRLTIRSNRFEPVSM